ncbi:MAG TPA: phosphorylase [Clostridium sp.]|nr:phosphorylase [Clostridium sp.]
MKLTEFDSNKKAVINAEDVVNKIEGCPETIVTCFSKKIINKAVEIYKPEVIGFVHNANGDIPFYKLNINGKRIGLIMSMVGAPAVVSQYEDLFVMGVKNILVFGTCGVLDKSIEDCSIIIPNKAVRDEGTSFHYAKSSDEIYVNSKALEKMIEYFNKRQIKYVSGKVWTTDGSYRETAKKVKKRKEENCICVDMECSAIAALAQFRNKDIGQFFYAADNLDSERWEPRSLISDVEDDMKTKILNIALELAEKLYL